MVSDPIVDHVLQSKLISLINIIYTVIVLVNNIESVKWYINIGTFLFMPQLSFFLDPMYFLTSVANKVDRFTVIERQCHKILALFESSTSIAAFTVPLLFCTFSFCGTDS